MWTDKIKRRVVRKRNDGWEVVRRENIEMKVAGQYLVSAETRQFLMNISTPGRYEVRVRVGLFRL